MKSAIKQRNMKWKCIIRKLCQNSLLIDLRESLEILSGDKIKIKEREREKKKFVGQIKINFSTKIFYPQKYGRSLNKKSRIQNSNFIFLEGLKS